SCERTARNQLLPTLCTYTESPARPRKLELLDSSLRGNHSHNLLDERSRAPGSRGKSSCRACADDGGTARGPSFAGPPREAGMLSRVRFAFCESETIRSKRRLCKISTRI